MGSVLFQDFVNEKKVHQAQAALTRLMKDADDVESQDDNGVDRDDTRHLGPEIAETDDSFGTHGDDQAIDIAQMLMDALKNVRDVTGPSFWESSCKSMWWPFDDQMCMEMRCTSCFPSIASGYAVCKMQGTSKSHKCMQKASTMVFDYSKS